jgi:murein DD-endopeptidase MepM/ murein hydrolase activator NlpD
MVGKARDAAFGPMAWPVRGIVTSPFGWRQSPFGDLCEWHPGIDITAAYGTPVRATADGAVAFAGRVRGYGVLVVLDHGTATTRYAHLAGVGVHVGQAVRRGDPVGTLGRTGRATAPHLHYEVRRGEEAVDPEPLLVRSAASRFAGHRSDVCAVARAHKGRDAIRMVSARDAGR